MSKARINDKIKLELAIKSGGCCERCNIYLWEDFLTKTPVKFAEHAHIIPDSPDEKAPRAEDYIEDYDRESCDNLMLLCSNCHTVVDKRPDIFTTKKLKYLKQKHEDRIRYLVSLKDDKQANAIIFNARIKDKDTIFNKELIQNSILDDGYYPGHEIDLSCNMVENDDGDMYYKNQVSNLILKYNMFEKSITEGKAELFAIAPQPLLIRLGMLLDSKLEIIVKQKTRIPNGWCFMEDVPNIDFILIKPDKINKENEVCILFSISDNVDIERVNSSFEGNKDIWIVKIDNPNMNCILSNKHIQTFENFCLQFLDKIKNVYGIEKNVHIFPVMPNSLAITLGRYYMPKVHNGLIFYDQIKNEKENTFKKAFSYIDGKDIFEE